MKKLHILKKSLSFAYAGLAGIMLISTVILSRLEHRKNGQNKNKGE